MDVRFKLRDLRIREGLTQQELADAVGLSRTSITNLEQARQSLSLDNLLYIAAALGYSVELAFKKVKS